MTSAVDYGPLLAELSEEMERCFPRSAALQREACRYLVDGGSHPLRLMEPFPPRIAAAEGGWVHDVDDHGLLDFWQGHMANVLGHNPTVVTSEVAMCLAEGYGLQLGMTDPLQVEVAEILCRQTGADKVRLTTSGTLASMYATMLARAFTRRSRVLKVGNGWHGAQPWSLKGCHFSPGDGAGYGGVDSEGLSPEIAESIVVTGFNDPERLRDDFRRWGDELACFIVEPLIGSGGMIPATREYLRLARELTHQHGALLIFDEVIDGFRFRAGDLGSLYGVAPDLAIYGKAIGGGMPVAALAGRDEVMALLGRAAGSRVAAFGGTYSAHPASLLAARVYLNHLVEHEDEVYGRLADLGRRMREAMVSGFSDEGLFAVCTGGGPDLPTGSSVAMVHFPRADDTQIDTPEQAFDPRVCDVALRTQVLGPALLLESVHMVHGHGAAAVSHTGEDMAFLREACARVARRVKRYLRPSGRPVGEEAACR